MTNDMQSRIVERFLTAADDPKKLLQKGLDDPGLKHVKRAWEDFTKGVAEAQRQYNSVGGAHPTSVINELVRKFIHRPLKDLGEEATGWANRIGKSVKTASDITAAKHPSASEMVRAATNKADAASVTLQEALNHLDTGYDEAGWDEKKHKDFQKGLDYAYKAIQKAKTEALKARRAIDNMRANLG